MSPTSGKPLPIAVRECTAADSAWVRRFLLEQLGSTRVVSRGTLHDLERLPGLVGLCDGAPSALLHYHVHGGALEVVSLYSGSPGRGLGSALLAEAARRAQALGCRRAWLVTTNDNEPAIRFYGRRGWRRVAVHPGAVDAARRLKPEIPLRGRGGVPIRDEIEFELRLGAAADAERR